MHNRIPVCNTDPTMNKFYENKIVAYNVKRLSATLRNAVFLAMYHYNI